MKLKLTTKRGLAIIAIWCALIQAIVPDTELGSPRAIFIGVGLASAALSSAL